MFQVGDQVVYGVHGVCQVADIQERMVGRTAQQYLILEPVGRGGSQYMVPTGNEAAMSKVSSLASREELEGLLTAQTTHTSNWIPDENKRKQFYRTLNGAGRESLMQTIYTLYAHRANQRAQGKRLHMCDDNFLRDAEKILSQELEIVFGLTGPEALSHLRTSLGG